jgi:alkylated DNA repair dioxygenase AlkB
VDHQLNLLSDARSPANGPAVDPAVRPERLHLDDRCWVDLWPAWLLGADEAMRIVTAALRWTQGERIMWGTPIEEPRLTAGGHAEGPGMPPLVPVVADALSSAYGQPLRSMWANWYRSGDDAVAWHADRIGRHERDPLVAIVSLGGPRPFALRPKGGGRSRRVDLHSGDLLVMGGGCQHQWEHAVPRVRGGAERISLTFRRRTAGAEARWRATPTDPTPSKGVGQRSRSRTTDTTAAASPRSASSSTARSSPT